MSGWTEVYVVGAVILTLLILLFVLAALHLVLKTLQQIGALAVNAAAAPVAGGGTDRIEALLKRLEADAAHFEALARDGGEAFSRAFGLSDEDRRVLFREQRWAAIMTPEEAESRIVALRQDRDWQARWLAGGDPELAEWDRLTDVLKRAEAKAVAEALRASPQEPGGDA